VLGVKSDRLIRQALQVQKAQDTLGTLDDRFIRKSEKELSLEIEKARLSSRANEKFAELKDMHGLQVELGGGSTQVRDSWLNIDLLLPDVNNDIRHENGRLAFINYDLRLGLPLSNKSCSFIYSSHFFEHLEYIDALNLLRDCHRCLEENGRLRLALPDYRNSFIAYSKGDYEYFRNAGRTRFAPGIEKGGETLADFLSLGIYERGQHKYIYDQEKCKSLLSAIGFKQVSESTFLDGLDVAVRQPYTFYVEAVK